MIELLKYILYPSIPVILLLFFLFSGELISERTALSGIYALILNVINFISAYFLFEISKNKSHKVFLKYNLGGMGLRLILILFGVFILIKFLNIELQGFILVFFFLYFVYITLEILHFHKNSRNIE
ncbi:MAG: hypothetical protein KJ799_13010 [Bacteroidetes bacterium]|nr:hypothetical protein [Bacteroidota bacterium]